MRPRIGLRHDVDTAIGLLRGVGRLVEVEDRLDARSSFYVRARIVERLGERACRLLRLLEDDGWEVGLHLDDSDGSLGTAYSEYMVLRRCGVSVRGVTVHGGIIGCRGWLTWRTIGMMGVEYIHGCPGALSGRPAALASPTIGLDHLIALHGPRGAVGECVSRASLLAYRAGSAVILAHPVYTVVSAAARFTQLPRRSGLAVRAAKLLEKLLAAAYTLAGRGLSTPVYSRVLGILRDEGFSLSTLHSLL